MKKNMESRLEKVEQAVNLENQEVVLIVYNLGETPPPAPPGAKVVFFIVDNGRGDMMAEDGTQWQRSKEKKENKHGG